MEPRVCAELLVGYDSLPATPDRAVSKSLQLRAASGGSLTYLGAEHSTDPGHPQFAAIEHAWNRSKPTIAFFEGPDRPIADERDKTIRDVGESGFVRFLARRDNVPVKTLEPSHPERAQAILRQFPEEEVFLFFVLREAVRLRDRKQLAGDRLDIAILELLAKARQIPGFASIFKDLRDLEAAYQRHFPQSTSWRAAEASWFAPTPRSRGGTRFTHAINRADSEFRNRFGYELLAKEALAGKRVFAVIGGDHVPMQAAALTCALAPE